MSEVQSDRPPARASVRTIVAASATAVAVTVGVLVLAGWLLAPATLVRLSPGGTPMNPLTAVCVILAGISLHGAVRQGVPVWTRLAALAVLGLAATRLLAALGGPDLEADRILFAGNFTGSGATPSRMAPNTAVLLVALGAALGLAGAGGRATRIAAELLAMGVTAGALVTLTGYLYSGRALYAIGTFSPMVLPTALVLAVLGTGVVASRPEHAITRLLASNGEAGRAARLLLPAALLVPLGVGWVRLLAERMGYIGLEEGVGLFVLATALTTAALIVVAGLRMLQAEAAAATGQVARDRLAAIVESSEDAIIAYDVHGVVASWNAGAERLYGYTAAEVVGHSVARIVPDDRPDELNELLALGSAAEPVHAMETVRVARDGRRLTVSLSLSPVRNADGAIVGASVIARDVTEQKRIAAQLEQVQRMETVGTLAGGVAHDFNNLLTVIGGHAGLLITDMSDDDPLHEDLEQIVHAATRAAQLTKQLLAFGQRSFLQPKAFDLNAIVGPTDRFLQRVIGTTIELETTLHPAPLPVHVDRLQTEQVLLNLVTNARDAMPNGGRIHVRTGVESGPGTRLPSAPNRYAVLEVQDTGRGMGPEVLANIFEPYFTTQERGSRTGTGLGLPMALGIVEQSGGTIRVESTPGEGSRFTVLLPLRDTTADPLDG